VITRASWSPHELLTTSEAIYDGWYASGARAATVNGIPEKAGLTAPGSLHTIWLDCLSNGWLRRTAQLFFEHLNGAADAQQGVAQVRLFGFQLGEHFLATLKLGFKVAKALLQLCFHPVLLSLF
jgi:hypothetical protein